MKQLFMTWQANNQCQAKVNFKRKLSKVEAEQLNRYRNGTVELNLYDPRKITPDQRRKIYALIGEITRWSAGDTDTFTKNYYKDILKERFCLEEQRDFFSLSSCSQVLAGEFIDWLIRFCFMWDVPFSTDTLDSIENSYGFLVNCLTNRKCCICGKHADICHIQTVGIGRNRNKISHIGMYVYPACRKHHQEQHNIGIKSFMFKYHIKGIKLNEELVKKLNLGNYAHIDKGELIL